MQSYIDTQMLRTNLSNLPRNNHNIQYTTTKLLMYGHQVLFNRLAAVWPFRIGICSRGIASVTDFSSLSEEQIISLLRAPSLHLSLASPL